MAEEKQQCQPLSGCSQWWQFPTEGGSREPIWDPRSPGSWIQGLRAGLARPQPRQGKSCLACLPSWPAWPPRSRSESLPAGAWLLAGGEVAWEPSKGQGASRQGPTPRRPCGVTSLLLALAGGRGGAAREAEETVGAPPLPALLPLAGLPAAGPAAKWSWQAAAGGGNECGRAAE